MQIENDAGDGYPCGEFVGRAALRRWGNAGFQCGGGGIGVQVKVGAVLAEKFGEGGDFRGGGIALGRLTPGPLEPADTIVIPRLLWRLKPYLSKLLVEGDSLRIVSPRP